MDKWLCFFKLNNEAYTYQSQQYISDLSILLEVIDTYESAEASGTLRRKWKYLSVWIVFVCVNLERDKDLNQQ